MALPTAAGTEAESQVIALLGPHILTALLLIPAAGPADAVELYQDAALPLVEALKMHPGAAGTVLIVAHHLLIVILLQVHWSPKAADQRRGTRSSFKPVQILAVPPELQLSPSEQGARVSAEQP